MINRSLKAIHSTLTLILVHNQPSLHTPELQNFYSFIVCLHIKIESYLNSTQLLHLNNPIIHEKKGTNSTRSLSFSLENEASTNGQQTNKETINPDNKNLGNSERQEFLEIMEKIIFLIEYYNQVQKELFNTNYNKSMTSVYSNENPFALNSYNFEHKDGDSHVLYLNNVKQNIEKVIDQCEEISQTFKELSANESIDKGGSESESNDKKSLLTEMLRESQLLESETEELQSPKKNGKRPMSEFNTVPQPHRRLLKEIDFSDYRIEGGNPKREKKVGQNNCGQCTECRIF